MKSYRLYIIFFLLYFSFNLQAQLKGKELADSLMGKLSERSEDTSKVNLLNELSTIYFSINPEQGINYGERALELAQKLKWKSGIAYAYLKTGSNYRMISNYPMAYELSQKALKIFEEMNDEIGIARATSNIGLVYWNQSNYPQALEYDLKALKIFERLKNDVGIASTLSNIGILYYEKGDYDQSMEYDNKALKIYEGMNDKGGTAASLASIGVSYNSEAKYEKALEYLFKALKMNEELGDRFNIASNLSNIGVVYLNELDYPEALSYYFKVLDIYESMGNKREFASSLGNIGSTYFSMATSNNQPSLQKLFGGSKQKALSKGKEFTENAIKTFKEIGDLSSMVYYYKMLSDIEMALGQHEAAFKSYKNYNYWRDSVFNMQEENKLTQTAMKYEFEKKESVTKLQQEKKDLIQRVIMISILIVLIILGAFSIIVLLW